MRVSSSICYVGSWQTLYPSLTLGIGSFKIINIKLKGLFVLVESLGSQRDLVLLVFPAIS